MIRITVICDICKKEETKECNAGAQMAFPGWETHNYDRNVEMPELPETHICQECYKHMKRWPCPSQSVYMHRGAL